jgi:hypothetical protein
MNIVSEVLSDIDFIEYDPGYFTGFGQVSTISYDRETQETVIVDSEGKPYNEQKKQAIGFY